MDLDKLRDELREAVKVSGKSQYDFAVTNGLKYFSFNKFLRGQFNNPRLSTLREFERALVSARISARVRPAA